MKTYEILKTLDGITRLRLLLHISLAEALIVAYDTDADVYHDIVSLITELNDKLNK